MGRVQSWITWGTAIFALNLAWEVSIYLSQAWPIYYPFIGMAAGGMLVVIGLAVSVVGWLKRAESSDAPDQGRMQAFPDS